MLAFDDTFWGIQPTTAMYRSGLLRVWEYRCCEGSTHGRQHWAQVHKLVLALSEQLQLKPWAQACVEVFAWTHELARKNDATEEQHSLESSEYFLRISSRIFPELDTRQRKLIALAIAHHADGTTAWEHILDKGNPIADLEDSCLADILGCCWDADRLDLLRMGVIPESKIMSTSAWQAVMPLAETLNRTPV